MSTECLYDKDAYISAFDAVVISCEKQGDLYALVLDKTAFFPEVGGQPADSGTLNGNKVLDVQLKGDEVVHFCDTSFDVGENVKGLLDWDERFSVMQQHSGEHLVSGIIHRRYGFDNIGFHMGTDAIAADFNGSIPAEDISDIELEANKAVWANVGSEILYPSGSELAQLDYRSKKAIEGQVRIVKFADIDSCACCGTHVRSTGEIGIIKILSCTRAHGGTRIELLCGKPALQYIQGINRQNESICLLLSAKPMESADVVRKLFDDKNKALAEMAQMEKKRFESIVASAQGRENCLFFEDGLTSEGVRDFAIVAIEHFPGVSAVFSGDEENGYKYAVGCHSGDLREFAKKMNALLQGRGGGKPLFIQGSVKAGKSEIEVFFAEYYG